jgi:hypothetical protein
MTYPIKESNMNENIEIIETIATDEQIEAVEEVDSAELLDEMTDEELAALVNQNVTVELSLEQIVDQLIEASKKTEFTMYAISVILNLTLETIGATKDGKSYSVRPQMVYNYNRNKMVAKDEKGKGVVIATTATIAQVRAFVIKFAAKFI